MSTLTLGEFREQTKDLPDDTMIFVDEGDLHWWDTTISRILPPVLEHPYALSLSMGQVWNAEYDIDHRIDAQLGNF